LSFFTTTPRPPVSCVQTLATHWSSPKVRAHNIIDTLVHRKTGAGGFVFLPHRQDLHASRCWDPLLSPSHEILSAFVPTDFFWILWISLFLENGSESFFSLPTLPGLFFLVLPLVLPFPLPGARIRILPSRLPALTMAFFPLLTSRPVFLPLLPGARALSPRARVRLNRLLLHPFLARHTRPWGRIPSDPLSFSSLPSPQFSPSSPHPSPFLASLPTPSPTLQSLPALLASLHSLLLQICQVAQCSVPCPFLADIACHYVSLCRSLIFLPPPSLLFPSATGEST